MMKGFAIFAVPFLHQAHASGAAPVPILVLSEAL
jgi:hypothetical protein